MYESGVLRCMCMDEGLSSTVACSHVLHAVSWSVSAKDGASVEYVQCDDIDTAA
jgi:hypothetical protein